MDVQTVFFEDISAIEYTPLGVPPGNAPLFQHAPDDRFPLSHQQQRRHDRHLPSVVGRHDREFRPGEGLSKEIMGDQTIGYVDRRGPAEEHHRPRGSAAASASPDDRAQYTRRQKVCRDRDVADNRYP